MIKCQTIADSSVRRSCILKNKASSPAVATESLSLSRVINANENCDIITLDTLSAFVQHSILESASGKQTIWKICRTLVDVLCEIAPEVCKNFITHDNNNNKMLHANALKLLHRM